MCHALDCRNPGAVSMRRKRRVRLPGVAASKCLVCLMLLALGWPSPAQQADRRLNVLFIVSDDLNNSLGCYGNPTVRTPNLDRLAERGVRFDRAYVQTALCNPSRVSFLSGLRPDTTGIHDLKTPTRTYLKDYVFLPGYFRNSGYFSAGVGKVFHTGEGFEDPASWDIEIREWGKTPLANQIISSYETKGYRSSWDWQRLNISDAEMPDGTVVTNVVQILERKRPSNKPFFLGVGFRRPHRPYAAPTRYFDLYPPDKMLLPDEPPEHLRHIPLAAFTYDPSLPDMPPDKKREGIAAYYACVTFVDAQVGRLMEALDRNQLWDSTVVVFIGDHGYHLGEHGGMWHKQSNFEESARAPLIIVAPGKQRNAASARVVEFLDLYPTVVELAGLAVPKGLQGVSLVPLLEDPKHPWDHPAFTQNARPGFMGRSVRTERWRYIEWDDGRKGVQLYDHDTDPREYVNLAQDPKHADTIKSLKKILRESTQATPVAGMIRKTTGK